MSSSPAVAAPAAPSAAPASPLPEPATPGGRPRHGRFHTALLIAGSQCSFFIGAAFSTGQESLQYFTAHGWPGIAMAALMVLVFTWSMSSLTEWGRRTHGTDLDPFTTVTGPVIGWVLRVVSPLFVFSIAVMMLSGAGALMSDMYGWPSWGGAVLLAVLLVVTLVLGFRGLVEIIGRLGPVLVLFVALVGVWILLRHGGGLADAEANLALLPEGTAATPHPLLSMASYSFAMLVIGVPFLTQLGRGVSDPARSTVPGSLLGALIFGGAMLVTSLALLATLPLIADSGTPLILLGKDLAPWLGTAFAVAAFLAIYSTAAPMVWSVIDQLRIRGAAAYRVAAVVVTVAALLLGLSFDFSQLVGAIYPKVAYVGFLFFGIVLARQVLVLVRGRRPSADT